jgi:hypothetical protein
VFLTAGFITLTTLKSQTWLGGGNVILGVNGINPTNNFLGTAPGNNTWLRMGVNGAQDIFIDNNPAQLFTGSAASGKFNV